MPLSLDELIRVFVGLQVHAPAGEACILQDADVAQCCLDARSIAVVGEQDMLCVALDHLCLTVREGCAEGGDCHVKARLVLGDDIHISFTENEVPRLALSCDVQAVKVSRLVEDRRLRGVEVLGLSVAHDTAAEADDPVCRVHDGIHDPVPKLVVQAPLLIKGRDSGCQDVVIGKALFAQHGNAVIVGAVRIPQPEPVHRVHGELSGLEVLHPLLPPRGAEELEVIGCRLLVDGKQDVPLLCPLFCLLGVVGLREGDAGPLRQDLQRLLEAVVLILHQERDHRSALPAAEAVVELLPRGDIKARRLVRMERAHPLVLRAGLLEGDILSDHVNDVIRCGDLTDYFIRIIHCTLLFLLCLPAIYCQHFGT